MIKYFFSLVSLVLVCTFAVAQTATLKNIETRSSDNKRAFRFPIIELSDASAAAEINSDMIEDVIERLVETDMPLVRAMTLKEALLDVAKNSCSNNNCSLTGLDYKVLYNKNGLLSLRITLENVQTRIHEKDFYFNYDLKTGNRLELSDVVRQEQMAALMSHFRQNVSLRNDIIAEKILQHPNFKNDVFAKQKVLACLEKIAKPILRDFAFTDSGLSLVTDYQSFVDILQAKPKDDFFYDYKLAKFYLNPTILQALHIS